MYKELEKRINHEATTRKESAAAYILENENALRNSSTATRWAQYQSGAITKEKAIELATLRSNKEIDKATAKKLEQLNEAATAEDVQSVSISVEWKRNATWGYNPTATATIKTAHTTTTYTGHASGCGYDKRSAAIAEALNQSASIKKMLYSTKEKALTATHTQPTKNEDNRNLIHYGAGYGALPYFEGGVGFSSQRGVFEACGYILKVENDTKTTDFYYFERA